MEMVKLCYQFFIIKCLGSSAWVERCLGKAKVAGPNPAQGFSFQKEILIVDKHHRNKSWKRKIWLSLYNHYQKTILRTNYKDRRIFGLV
jgi:hypothetical protein